MINQLKSALHFPLFSRNISYVFLFLRNFKISQFPSVFTVYFDLFSRGKRRKKPCGCQICDAFPGGGGGGTAIYGLYRYVPL